MTDVFEHNAVRILTVTWNLASQTPELRDLRNLLHPDVIHHDIFVIGTQEALGGIVGSMFSPSKEVMNKMIQECLGPNYIMLQSVCLQATHMVIFISKKLVPLVSNVKTDVIATGFKNMVGNKGAVKI